MKNRHKLLIILLIGFVLSSLLIRSEALSDLTFEQEFKVLKLELEKLTFTSDHGVLIDYNANFAGSGETVYDPRGWQKDPVVNNPISHTKGSTAAVNVMLRVKPSGVTFDLEGSGAEGLDFHKNGLTSTGSAQTAPLTADNEFPSTVDIINSEITWRAIFNGTICTDHSGPHKMYLTWGTPVGSPTERRINWVCSKAKGQSTEGGCADKLWDGVAAETTFGNTGTDGWALLDGGSGDCDNQARCMKYAVEILGAGPATVRLVRASTNVGAGNCLDLESRIVGTQTHYLLMDFDSGAGYKWNAFEGCCEASGSFYAITPKIKADNDYEMLKAIGCQQYWVRTNVNPGAPGWSVIEVFEEVPIP